MQWWKQTEVHVHRLKRGRPCVDGVDVSARDVGEQGPMGRSRGRKDNILPTPFGDGKTPGQQTDGGRFHVPLAAGDLASKPPAVIRFEAQRFIEQFWGIEKRVAMQPAKPGKFGVLQARDCPKDADLLAVPELGLKT